MATTPAVTGATAAQLWPEHFDLACTVVVGGEVQVNVGASPGDAYEPAPYLYIGPWGPERPGDPAYWNAPFGACSAGTRSTAGRRRWPSCARGSTWFAAR